MFDENTNQVCRNVSIRDDDAYENDEQFTLDLTTSDGSVDLDPDMATVTITHSDSKFSLALLSSVRIPYNHNYYCHSCNNWVCEENIHS